MITAKRASTKMNYIYSLLYQVTAIFVPLITTPYLSRVLMAEGIGSYGYTYSIVAIFTLLGLFGFNIYGQREIAKNSENIFEKSKVFLEIMIAKLIVSLISIIVFLILVFLEVFGKAYTILFICFLPSILSTIIDSTFLLKGDEQFRIIALRDFIIKIIGIICVFVFVRSKNDIWIYALCHSIIAFSSIASLLFYIPKKIIRIPLKKINFSKHFAPAFRLFIPAISALVFVYLGKALIQWITNDTSEVGYYEQAEKLITMLFGIITTLSAVMIPRNSAIAKKGNIRDLHNNIEKVMKFSFFITFPMMFGILSISKIFCPVFFGPGFDKTSILFSILSPMLVLMSISNILGMQYLVPINKEKIYSKFIFLIAMFNILVSSILIYFFSSIGAVLGALLAEFLGVLLFSLYCRKEINTMKILLNSWKVILSSAIMFIIVLFTANIAKQNAFTVLLLAIEGISVYCFFLFLLKDEMFLLITKTITNAALKITHFLKKK
ncbi:MAG: oligosaccharide flippase family protein [Clostridia bacterium]|nr:oligosaccharide flippase family protein [Clostridia bacterium]